MKDDLNVIEVKGKFVVTNNGTPIKLPKSEGSTIVTEFDNKTDAERYVNILKSLRKNPAGRV